VSGLTNGTTYTFTVTAANAAGTGPASAATAAGSPFGPPRTPSINSNSSGTTVNFSWDSNPQSYANGRQITSMEVTFNGSGVSNNGSFSRDIGYSASGTLKIRVCAAEGGCQEATGSASTGAAPQRNKVISISQGDGGWITATFSGFEANRRMTAQCWVTTDSSGRGGSPVFSYDVTTDGSGNAVKRGCHTAGGGYVNVRVGPNETWSNTIKNDY
jgi:hypothetical protein